MALLSSPGFLTPPIDQLLNRVNPADPLSVEPALRWHARKHGYSIDFGFGEPRAAFCRVGGADVILLRLRQSSVRLVERLHNDLGHELLHLEQARRTHDPAFLDRARAVVADGRLKPARPRDKDEVYLSSWWECDAFSWSAASELYFTGHPEWPGLDVAVRKSEALQQYADVFGVDHPVTQEVAARAAIRLQMLVKGR